MVDLKAPTKMTSPKEILPKWLCPGILFLVSQGIYQSEVKFACRSDISRVMVGLIEKVNEYEDGTEFKESKP